MPIRTKPSHSEASDYWRKYFDLKADDTTSGQSPNGYLSHANARLMHNTVQKTLGPIKNQRILDVGCGDGKVTGPLTIHNEVVGLDFSSRMLHLALQSGLVPVCADMLAPPFPPDSFDIVVCVEAMTCLSHPLEVLPSLVKVLRPGGYLLIGGLNFHSALRRLVQPLASKLGTHQPKLITPRECIAKLTYLGVDQQPIIWIAYYPSFILQDRPTIMNPIIKRVATNFLIKGFKR